jgi:integrase/recombinase XerD
MGTCPNTLMAITESIRKKRKRVSIVRYEEIQPHFVFIAKEAQSISEEQLVALLEAAERQEEEIRIEMNATTGKTVLWMKRLFAVRRDSVILKLLLSTGLRVSEALSIKYTDIDFENKTIQILGKGKKYRQVLFDLEEVESGFLEYLMQRQKLDTDHEYIFVSIKKYARLSVRGFQVLLKKYLDKAGLSQSITPHVLRHTFATISIEKGANIKAVSQILGHSSCKITIDTYTHLSNSHIRAVMKKCNPLSNETISLEERIEGRKKHLAYLEKTG